MTAWHFNPELTFEKVGDDWLVLNPDAAVVLRASGPAAEVLTATATASPAPAHLADAAAALAERGVLVEDAAPGMSRRRLISTGALAAGAATLAAAAGIHTLVLPTAAAAASLPAAPPGSGLPEPGVDRVRVSWTNIVGSRQPTRCTTGNHAAQTTTSPFLVLQASGPVTGHRAWHCHAMYNFQRDRHRRQPRVRALRRC